MKLGPIYISWIFEIGWSIIRPISKPSGSETGNFQRYFPS